MKTRQFIVYSLIYLIVVVALVYVLDSGDYNLSLLGYELNLPIAIWFGIPVVVFALLATLHMVYHSVGFYSYKRAIRKDTQLYHDFAKEIFLALPSNKEFKTDVEDLPSAITRILSPWGLYKDVNIQSEELKTIISNVKSVQNGEVVELKRYKLSKDNPLYLKNELNKIENLKDYYLEILKTGDSLEVLKYSAYKKLINFGAFADIKRFSINSRTSDDIMIIINRFVNNQISMSSDEIFELLDDDNVSSHQYIKVAILLKDKLNPESYRGIFDGLRNSHQDALEAYLYTLYELGLVDELRELLQGSESGEYERLKILLFLRDHSKIVPASLLFNDRF